VLAAVHAVQRFRHYILFLKTTVIVVVNSFQYMLKRRVISGKISRRIVFLQEFDLDFISMKCKKSVVFAEIISELSVESGDVMPKESPIQGDMFFRESFSHTHYNNLDFSSFSSRNRILETSMGPSIDPLFPYPPTNNHKMALAQAPFAIRESGIKTLDSLFSKH
jgi:hypothetical protein